MANDKLFQKRKARKALDLARKAASRSPYQKVLIVCEGEKTEPNYFNDLKDHYGLNSANVEICGDCGSDPRSIFTYAKRRYRKEYDAGDAFDKVYCVFDKDQHAHYQTALNNIRQANPQDTYIAITSVPCFEYWLLLHFELTTSPHNNCAGVLSALKSAMPDYSKSHTQLFTKLLHHLDDAKTNATKALASANLHHTDNPTTHVHELVTFLQQIKT